MSCWNRLRLALGVSQREIDREREERELTLWTSCIMCNRDKPCLAFARLQVIYAVPCNTLGGEIHCPNVTVCSTMYN